MYCHHSAMAAEWSHSAPFSQNPHRKLRKPVLFKTDITVHQIASWFKKNAWISSQMHCMDCRVQIPLMQSWTGLRRLFELVLSHPRVSSDVEKWTDQENASVMNDQLIQQNELIRKTQLPTRFCSWLVKSCRPYTGKLFGDGLLSVST